MINIYKTGTFYKDLQNEAVMVNMLRENLTAAHIKANIRVRDNIIDFTAKRKKISAIILNGKILVDEYQFDDAEDAVEYVFGVLKGKQNGKI